MDALTTGQVLKVVSTDPGTAKDMPSWSERTGNPIVKEEQEGSLFVFYIQHK